MFTGGVVTDNTRWDITRLLDLPQDGTFAVVVAETSDPTGSACLDIERALDAIRMARTGGLLPAYQLGIVSIGTAERLSGLVEILRAHTTGRVGVSPAFTGLETRRSEPASRYLLGATS